MHHGNGSEAIYLDDPNTLTISVQQDHNYPLDTGGADVCGKDGSNINIPLPPGGGHKTYLRVMEHIICPALQRFKPDLIVVACGFDAAAIDPLSRMLATSATFRTMTAQIKAAAQNLCDGRLVLVHEGAIPRLMYPFAGTQRLPNWPAAPLMPQIPLLIHFPCANQGLSFRHF